MQGWGHAHTCDSPWLLALLPVVAVVGLPYRPLSSSLPARLPITWRRSGGVQGGISNGEDIVIRVAFKPTATIARRQATVSRGGEDIELLARGRHDPCVVPRAVPMVESMVALVLADQLLQHFAQCELLPRDDAQGPDSKARTQFSEQLHQQQHS